MLDLDPASRARLWDEVKSLVLETYGERDVAPELDRLEIRRAVEAFTFEAPMPPEAAIAALAEGLRKGQVHTAHARYFGLLQATPSAMATAASALTAAYNPQLATERHAPFAVAMEEHLVRAIAERFGYARADAEGTFTSGGAEANGSAVLAALAHHFPDSLDRGLRSLPGDPVVYVSSEGHPTIARAARAAGLGSDAVRVIPADGLQRMKVPALREALARDRAAGALPLMIATTAGTTSAGAIDPLGEIADVAAKHGAWLHVDAAWGGLAAMVPELRPAIAGIERADSITFDPHKALSLPLGAGMFVTRRSGVLARAFHARAGYMPRDASRDPYAHGMIWSRRFVGAQLFTTLAVAGWSGLAASLRAQAQLAERLRGALATTGWKIVNETPLPVVCFVDPAHDAPRWHEAIVRSVIASGAGWLSVTRLASGARAIRACITSHRTRAEDVDALVDALSEARGAL